MENLKSFLKLLRHLNKLNVHEYEDRIELDFEVSLVRQLNIDLDEWLKKAIFGLQVGSEWSTDWNEIENTFEKKCLLNLNKPTFIKKIIQVEIDATQIVFFTHDYFNKWIEENSNPFLAIHPFYNSDKALMWVNGFSSEQIGSKLSVIPLGKTVDDYFQPIESSLPGDEEIRSHVNFVSRDSVTIIPEKFRLPDAAFYVPKLKPFFISYTLLLSACLVKEFYSRKNVVVSGIKRISLSLYSTEGEDFSLENIRTIENAVRWVYGERTETRLILLMDRVSLDLPENGIMIPSIFENLSQALEQAKYRYEFVIKDRQEAHAKELAELQKDLKSATDGYSESINAIVSGLLKDALSSVFVLGIGILSKAITNESLVNSKQAQYLFRGLAIYLAISIISRLIVNSIRLCLSKRDIEYWNNTTRNHMSIAELERHIKLRTRPYRNFFIASAILIVLIYIPLCYFIWDFQAFLSDTPSIISEYFVFFKERIFNGNGIWPR